MTSGILYDPKTKKKTFFFPHKKEENMSAALKAKELQADAALVAAEQQPNKQAATLNAFLDEMRALNDREKKRQQIEMEQQQKGNNLFR